MLNHTKGGTTYTVVDHRLLFASALKANALALIIAHNHPSGNLKPSYSDLQLTKKIQDAGEILGIQLMDHLILSSEGYLSMADEALL